MLCNHNVIVFYFSVIYATIHFMMAANNLQIFAKHLTCQVCYELFKDPKQLPCGHSYCVQCLETMWVKFNYPTQCPLCRREVIIPPGGVKNFPSNFLLCTMVEDFLQHKLEGEKEI